MRNFFVLLLVSLTIGDSLQAQFSRYLVQFTDKNGTTYSLSNPQAFLSEQSIQRREKQHLAIDSTDLPLNAWYVDSVLSIPGVQLLNVSKWFNQVLIRIADSSSLGLINAFPFVKKTAPVAMKISAPGHEVSKKIMDGMMSRDDGYWKKTSKGQFPPGADSNFYNYGASFPQIHIHQGEYLHNLGFHGENMTIAVLDAGFYEYLTNPAFDSLVDNHQVLGTYDFVNLKQSVVEENVHGAYCLSILAADISGQMIGSAPKAKFWLFKTEDVNSEYPVEEQNWVAAAEFADSAGADIISTSLGYAYFDDSIFNLNYAQRNGHTALISIAANYAVAKGMIVTASAGNSGTATDQTKYILCPADADSSLAIGATDTSGLIAPFSSWGPNSSGQTKPDVVSVGEGTTIAAPDGTIGSGNGTSFSNPNLAGLITCLWQAFPLFTNHQIIQAVQESSSRYATPDDRYGFGIPDFKKAYNLLAQEQMLQTFISSLGTEWISVYPNPYNAVFTVLFKAPGTGNANVQLLDMVGRIIDSKVIAVVAGQYYTVSFAEARLMATGIYVLHFNDGVHQAALNVLKR